MDETKPAWRRASPWGLAGIGLTALGLLIIRLLDGFVRDDAFIYYRFARNIATGNGWVFNQGAEATSSATSPLWTLLLAASHPISEDLSANADVLYAALVATAALITFATLRRLHSPGAAIAAVVILYVSPWTFENHGMESALFVALLSSVLHVWTVRRNLVASGVLGALLTLARPEGVLLLLMIVAVETVGGWRRAGRVVAGAAIIGLPWMAFSWKAFGSIIPATARGKVAQGRSGFFGEGLVFVRHVRDLLTDTAWFPLVVVLAVAGLVLAWLSAPVTRRYLAMITLFPLAAFVGYAIVLRPALYMWYLVPQYFGLTVLAGLGVAEIAVRVSALTLRARWLAPALVVVALAAVAFEGQDGRVRGYPYDGYDRATAWLRTEAGPDATVANAEIGVFGWQIDQPMIDYLGLLDEESASELETGDLSSWFTRTSPEYFVVHIPAWVIERPAMRTEEFARYVPVFETHEGATSGHLRVFRRTDGAAVGEISPALIDQLRAAVGEVSADEERAVDGLARFALGDDAVGPILERPEGFDLGSAIRWATANDEALANHLDASQIEALNDLANRMNEAEVVGPLV